MSEKGKKKHRIGKWKAWSVLVTFFGVIPCLIFNGGIDCEPPDDADLIIPLRDKPFESDGNGWVMLTNVLAQVDAGEIPFWNQLVLDWYAHPEWNHDFDIGRIEKVKKGYQKMLHRSGARLRKELSRSRQMLNTS